ncbi:MAG: bifunctional DNA primase/polymerase [Deinococcus sp.]
MISSPDPPTAASPDELLRAAGVHLRLGRSLLPVGSDKRPHGRALISTGHLVSGEGGRPRAAWQALQTTPPTPGQLRRWLEPGRRGLGLVTGRVSGVVVIDVDWGEGLERFSRWGLTHRAHVRTRSGGLHWYLRHPGWPVKTVQSQTNARLASVRGIDLRGDGGYVVIPPTRFWGAGYQALRDHRDLDDAALLPEGVRVLLGLHAPPGEPGTPCRGRPARPLGHQGGEPLEGVLLRRSLELARRSGRRNESGFWLACQLRDNGFSAEDATEVMRRYSDGVPDTDGKGERGAYTLGEALRSLEQAYRRRAREAWK